MLSGVLSVVFAVSCDIRAHRDRGALFACTGERQITVCRSVCTSTALSSRRGWPEGPGVGLGSACSASQPPSVSLEADSQRPPFVACGDISPAGGITPQGKPKCAFYYYIIYQIIGQCTRNNVQYRKTRKGNGDGHFL